MTQRVDHRPVIGIAGGIGSGKSAVARALADRGCVVANSDESGRAALRDPEIMRTLVAWWGEAILDADGEIDRRAVARIVFADPAERRRLESVTHPWIETRRHAQFASAPVDVPAFVIDAPLLYEVGLDRACTHVIFVDAARSIRLDRVRSARGWSESELERREESQLPLDEKRRRADHVVRNETDLTSLDDQVQRILDTILHDRGPHATTDVG